MAQKEAPKKTDKVIVEDPLNVFRFENEWSTGPFVCCEDCRLTTCTYLCLTCVICSLIQDLKESCCTFICLPFPLIVYRMKMRSNLRIKGSMWRDTLMSTFLPFCTVIQMKTELKQRGLAN